MPEIRSLSFDGDRIQIVHSTGRLALSVAPLLLRPTGEGVFNLNLRRLHGGILLAGVSGEHAGQLALFGVEVESERKPMRKGWRRGVFYVLLGEGVCAVVLGATRRGLGVHSGRIEHWTSPEDYRAGVGGLPKRCRKGEEWALTDLLTGKAVQHFGSSAAARFRADEIEASPELQAKLAAYREETEPIEDLVARRNALADSLRPAKKVRKARTPMLAAVKAKAPKRGRKVTTAPLEAPLPVAAPEPLPAPQKLTPGRKAAETKGPEGLSAAARKAAATRAARRREALQLAA